MGYAGDLYPRSLHSIFMLELAHNNVGLSEAETAALTMIPERFSILDFMAGCDHCACFEGAELDIAGNARTHY